MDFNVIPLQPNCTGHATESSGIVPHRSHVVRFSYPDGERTFDGRDWVAYPHDSAAKVTHTYTPG